MKKIKHLTIAKLLQVFKVILVFQVFQIFQVFLVFHIPPYSLPRLCLLSNTSPTMSITY